MPPPPPKSRSSSKSLGENEHGQCSSKCESMGGALGLIAVLLGIAAWAETPAPADLAQEDAYLDVLPKVEIPEDVQPIPGAVNEEFRNCQASWPAGYELAQSGPEARALRDIYGFVRARNVISTQDCGLLLAKSRTGKMSSDRGCLARVIMMSSASPGSKRRRSLKRPERLTAIAETMCGGSF